MKRGVLPISTKKCIDSERLIKVKRGILHSKIQRLSAGHKLLVCYFTLYLEASLFFPM